MASVAESPNRLFWLIVLALFFPFFSVGIEFGYCTQEFWLNLVLSLIIPFCGFIHAVYLLVHARYSRAPSRSGYEPVGDGRDAECGTQPAAGPRAPVQHPQHPQQPQQPQHPHQQHQPLLVDVKVPAAPAAAPAPAPGPEQGPSEPPPYTPGAAATFDNKIQRS